MSELCSSKHTCQEKIALLKQIIETWEGSFQENSDEYSVRIGGRGELIAAKSLLDDPLGREIFETILAEYLRRLNNDMSEEDLQEALVDPNSTNRFVGMFIASIRGIL